jgi:hypothetical protein
MLGSSSSHFDPSATAGISDSPEEGRYPMESSMTCSVILVWAIATCVMSASAQDPPPIDHDAVVTSNPAAPRASATAFASFSGFASRTAVW